MNFFFFEIKNPGSKRACACSEAGSISQNGDRARELYYGTAAFCCAFFFFVGKKTQSKNIRKEMFPVYVEVLLA
jgi:hypothetical protein